MAYRYHTVLERLRRGEDCTCQELSQVPDTCKTDSLSYVSRTEGYSLFSPKFVVPNVNPYISHINRHRCPRNLLGLLVNIFGLHPKLTQSEILEWSLASWDCV